MRLCVYGLLLAALGASTAAAQSLADVARKESERRQTVGPAGKTYTNTDLKPVPVPALAGTPDTTVADDQKSADDKPVDTGADAAADKVDEKAQPAADAAKAGKVKEDKQEVKDAAYWSKRMADLRDQLDRDQTYIDALQSRINALTSDFVNRDDPIQRNQIATDRQKALSELDRLKKTVEQDKKAIGDAEDEARRANVPPGWLR
jgi:hypothetical protein